jgi:hypothetical protein
MMRGLSVALCLTASPVLAEEVLYCVDTQVVGFVWDKSGEASVIKFRPIRYTIKVSETERVITRMVSVTAGNPTVYKCKRPFTSSQELACDDGSGMQPWVFHRNTYTRSFLYGPPGGDPNISVAYGTCTKF